MSVEQYEKKSFYLIFVFSFLGMLFLNIFFPKQGEAANKYDAAFAKNQILECKLSKIADGDTIEANCSDGREKRHLRIRLAGIDAPEIQQKPWGTRSKAALRKLLPSKTSFVLLSMGEDYYKRQLGIAYKSSCYRTDKRANKCDINLQMLEKGMAVAYSGLDTPREYVHAARRAKEKKQGLWKEHGLQQDPKKWRRQHN